MIDIKRPGTGIPPKYLNKIVGSKSRRDIGKDEVILWSDIEFINSSR